MYTNILSEKSFDWEELEDKTLTIKLIRDSDITLVTGTDEDGNIYVLHSKIKEVTTDKKLLFNALEDLATCRFCFIPFNLPSSFGDRLIAFRHTDNFWNSSGLTKAGIEEYESILTDYGLHQGDGRLPAFDAKSSKELK